MASVDQAGSAERLKARQADYYDHAIGNREFEINRPHGESRLYQYAMEFKFKRLLDLLGHGLNGFTVLAVCCGSGMDAEFLASAGADVVALDISFGCLRRADERRNRFGARYELIQGDIEHLPFTDAAFDYSFVHDGLHHLADHAPAIREMARVARLGVLVSEPAKAAVTSIPTSLGLLSAREEAGNTVNRVEPSLATELLRESGFDRVRSSRFLLKYGHPPARWWRRLDGGAFPVGKLAVGIGASVLSPVGNKLVLVAERTAARK